SLRSFLHFSSASDPSTSRLYPLSLHDALPILPKCLISIRAVLVRVTLIIIALALLPIGSVDARGTAIRPSTSSGRPEPVEGRLRSEEHTSELQSRVDLVCRLLLEKNKS